MKVSDKPLVLCLFGPTASGKTDVAVALREHLPIELISVDSALVYRGMDIGTAKPDFETLEKAPHRLIDICEPTESYSAARFRQDALLEIERITAQGRIPLLVGGTMLYFKALLEGMSPLPSADPAVRQRIEARAKVDGWRALHNQLAAIDPVAAERIHPNDPQRLGRALEVYDITGRTLTDLQQERQPAALDGYEVLRIALVPADRVKLHQRIELRFQMMLEAGVIAEVKNLKERGDLSLDLPSMRCVGYRQIWEFLDGHCDRSMMVEKGVAATRQLAKRQLTWLRSTEADLTMDPLAEGIESMVREITERCSSRVAGRHLKK